MKMRPGRIAASCRRLGRRFAGHADGAALIEFTLAFPIMVALFAGVVEFSEAFAVNRKLANAAATVSDLVSQRTQVTGADLDDIVKIADTLLSPYSATNLGLVISSVEADQKGATKVGWSYAHGTGASAHGQGADFSPPPGLTEPGSSIIVAEASYQFTPTVGMYLTGVITLTGQAYFRPRCTHAVEKIN
jgi:Flp pilus assembly protein TadG